MFRFEEFTVQRGLVVGVVSALVVLLSGCQSLGPIELPDESAYAPSEAEQWLSLAEVREEDWFYVMNAGGQALEWRLRMIDSATHSIDLQTFLWTDDSAGRAILRHLMDAADRGVRVRLLLDDTFTSTHAEDIWNVDHHPNISYRVYNPFSRRSSHMVLRQLMNLGDFSRLDHRMHNKVLIVDNRAVMVGGRNQADEYFGWSEGANFRDLELLCYGEIAEDLSDLFDGFWNNDWSFPEAMVIEQAKGWQTPEAYAAWLHSVSEPVLNEPATDRASAWVELAAQAMPANYRVLADVPAPTQPGVVEEFPNQLAAELVELFDQAEHELIIVTAYLIPTPELEAAVLRAEARGVQVRILTNSLRSNNHLSAHSAYRKHIHTLLEAGVDLHEVRAFAKDRARYMEDPVEAKRLGLHAKFGLIDDRYAVIGSANMDPRSLRLNTELALLLDSPELNEQLRELIAVDFDLSNAWHVQLQPDGSLRWVGNDVVLDAPPADSAFQNLEDWFLSHLPIEGEL